jgi:hypothetical protein
VAAPSLFGLIEPADRLAGWLHDVGIAWLALGVAGLLLRACCSCGSAGTWRTGLVWMSKILTDPFHDIWLYHKAPLHLLRGELIDPMHARARTLTGAQKRRWRSISRRTPRRIAVGLAGRPATTSRRRCICVAAATKRSQHASKSRRRSSG